MTALDHIGALLAVLIILVVLGGFALAVKYGWLFFLFLWNLA